VSPLELGLFAFGLFLFRFWREDRRIQREQSPEPTAATHAR
jgi:hypothetical protein